MCNKTTGQCEGPAGGESQCLYVMEVISAHMLLILGSSWPTNMKEVESWVDLGLRFQEVGLLLVRVKVKQ